MAGPQLLSLQACPATACPVSAATSVPRVPSLGRQPPPCPQPLATVPAAQADCCLKLCPTQRPPTTVLPSLSLSPLLPPSPLSPLPKFHAGPVRGHTLSSFWDFVPFPEKPLSTFPSLTESHSLAGLCYSLSLSLGRAASPASCPPEPCGTCQPPNWFCPAERGWAWQSCHDTAPPQMLP